MSNFEIAKIKFGSSPVLTGTNEEALQLWCLTLINAFKLLSIELFLQCRTRSELKWHIRIFFSEGEHETKTFEQSQLRSTERCILSATRDYLRDSFQTSHRSDLEM
jgi:hypothetical protein